MSGKGICAATLAAITLTVFSTSAAVASPVPASMQITEDFCGPGTTCGTVQGSLGAGTERTVIDEFTPVGGGCFHDVHTTTATLADGTITLMVDGTLCASPTPGNFTLTGTWTVRSGSGSYSAATGGGVVRAFRQNGPIHATLLGAIS